MRFVTAQVCANGEIVQLQTYTHQAKTERCKLDTESVRRTVGNWVKWIGWSATVRRTVSLMHRTGPDPPIRLKKWRPVRCMRAWR